MVYCSFCKTCLKEESVSFVRCWNSGWEGSSLSRCGLSAGALAGNVRLSSLGLKPASFKINGKISLTSLDIDYGHGELKTFMNINGLYWSMCLSVCCTLSAISNSILVLYREVTQKVNFTDAERFDTAFYLKVSSLLSVTNEVHKELDPLTTGTWAEYLL